MLSREWQKPNRSQPQGNCVELRQRGEAVQVRDSKLGNASPVLGIAFADYASLIEDLKRR
ncbi:DUF397 domain-containing protein [Glycomyces sp. L485]|uniref:DUF397 domain-containing protein n=1 Tax=Glycomyces sp. L485 TaxID=2909235 RepID=UPI001F4A593B|nr:DUF397 domain-containing protein [Glycomyces sp. L485]MCH7231881.1 DUF397 domain-containing protein [Glycomyces sp. L485]